MRIFSEKAARTSKFGTMTPKAWPSNTRQDSGKKDLTTVGLTIGGKTFGDERSGILDGKLFGLFQHSHGGRDVGGNTKEGYVLDFLEKIREKIM